MQRRLGLIFTYIFEWGQGTCKKSKLYPARAYITLVVLVFLMISHLDNYTATDVKLEMLSGGHTVNRILHDENNIRGIAHAHTYREDDIFLRRRLVQSFTCIREGGGGPKSQSFVKKVYNL